MKKKIFIWGIVLLTIVNIAFLGTIVYHKFVSEGEPHHENQHKGNDFLLRQLALSDTQAAQMKVLMKTFQTSIKPVRANLTTQRNQLFQFLLASKPDRSKIDSVRSTINSLQAELQKLVIDHLLEEKEILTPKQQSKFFSIIRERLMMEESHHKQNGLVPIDE